jgi:hypothetical protein
MQTATKIGLADSTEKITVEHVILKAVCDHVEDFKGVGELLSESGSRSSHELLKVNPAALREERLP